MSKTYQFTLVLDGVDDMTPNLEDALFEAGCDDSLINYKNATVYLDFDREGDNLEQVLISAIKAIEGMKIDAKVRILSVAPEHLVTLSDIAERVSMTRQAISLYMLGERGIGSFPKPVLKISDKSPLWRWTAVAEWFYKQGKIKDHRVIDDANIVEDINAVLELRSKKAFDHCQKILTQLG